MELAFNLAWGLLAASLFGLWLRFAPSRDETKLRMQIVALALLILVLFPVVSVTDDLQSALFAAETDYSLRRDQAHSNTHSIFPTVAALPPVAFLWPSHGVLRVAFQAGAPGTMAQSIIGDTIQNRPPPAA